MDFTPSEFFAAVYRVTTRNPVLREEDFAVLSDLPCPIPIGYREYLMTLGGEGEFCTGLRVWSPDVVVASHRCPNGWIEDVRKDLAERWDFGNYSVTPEDGQQVVIFADTESAEAWVCIPRFGDMLFHLERFFGKATPLPRGMVDACLNEMVRTGATFPYFDVDYGVSGRVKLQCDLRSDDADWFSATVTARWPSALDVEDRGTRFFFVREIEGKIEYGPPGRTLSEKSRAEIEPQSARLARMEAAKQAAREGQDPIPYFLAEMKRMQDFEANAEYVPTPASIYVSYDAEFEADVQSFVQSVQR